MRKSDAKLMFYIIVPVYKVEKYIKTCIDSVLNQTYQNFRLIVVDDGSPDNAGAICDEYALQDNRITVIHQENMGILAARQVAIKYIRGLFEQVNVIEKDKTYILNLDSDDSLKKDALEKISFVIQKYDCDMVIYGLERVSNGKTVYPYDRQKGYEGITENKRVLYNRVFNSSEYNPVCRKAIKLTLLTDTDYSMYYHISHGEDLLQSIVYYKVSKRVYFLNESLYNYTINPESITQTVTEKNFQINFEVRLKVWEFLKSEDVFTEEDWNKYTSYCIDLLVEVIKIILDFKIKADRKYQYFDEIKASEYFNKCIKNRPYDRKYLKYKALIYQLFVKRLYWLLLVIGKIYHILRK